MPHNDFEEEFDKEYGNDLDTQLLGIIAESTLHGKTEPIGRSSAHLTTKLQKIVHEQITKTKEETVREVIEKAQKMVVTKKKGFVEMIFGDRKSAKIRSHSNMDVGYNMAIEDVINQLHKEYNIKD